MTPRAIRRAAERRTNKLARKAAQHFSPADFLADETHSTENQLPTQNGQHAPTETQAQSFAPTIVPAPAANTCLTAITSALTGHATLLPAADATQYDQLIRAYQNEFGPVGLQESNLVQSLAQTAWRLRRTLTLEMTIFAKGRIEFAPQFAAHNPDLRESLIDVHTFLTYEKQIRGLQLQEARLTRRVDKDSAELRRLQQERRQREEHAHRKLAQQNQQPCQPEENGFEFANQEMGSHLTRKQEPNHHFANTHTSQTPVETAKTLMAQL